MPDGRSNPGVLAVLDAYREAVHAGDAARYTALFDDDVVWCPPGTPPVVGKAAVEVAAGRAFGARIGPPTFEMIPEHVDVVGNLATVVAHGWTSGEGSRDLTVCSRCVAPTTGG